MPKNASPVCPKCSSLRERKKGRWRCAECNRKRVSEWQKNNPEKCRERDKRSRKRNPEKRKEQSRSSWLKNGYGISLEEYNNLLEKQNGVCAICLGEETRRHKDGSLWSLNVDHCHATGEIRGLLCSYCNSGLSQFKDNIENLKSAIIYLQNKEKT